MDDRQAAKLKMYLNVQHVLQRNEPVWRTVAAYGQSLEAFNRNVEQINALNKQRQLNSKGITLSKTQAKELMVERTMLLAGAMKALASVTGDVVLTSNASINQTTLINTRDTDIDDLCQHLHDLAQEKLAALADFGITQADLDVVQQAIQTFTATIGKPKDTISQVKSFNEQIDSLFKANDKILNEQLDNLMYRFKASYVAFYNEYFSVRNAGISGSRNKKEAGETGAAEKHPVTAE